MAWLHGSPAGLVSGTMFAHLTAAFRQAGARGAVSVLCAVAFLLFTFDHATHHCGSAYASPLQIELTALDGSSDGPDKSSGPEHCCNCSTAAMINADTALPAVAPAPRLEAAVWRALHPSIPAAEHPSSNRLT